MAIQDCAVVAIKTFGTRQVTTPRGVFPLRVVMVAIAGAESSWNNGSQGDYGLSGPNCHGYTSWGLWQINSVHSAYLTRMTGSSNPCDWATWLYDPANNATAALAVLGSNLDLSAWTTWNTGAYLKYLSQAQDAVNAALASAQQPTGITKILGSPEIQFFSLIIGAVGTVLTVDQIFAKRNGHSNRRQVTRTR